MTKTVFWAVYHMLMIALLVAWYLRKDTCGVCFIGFMLIYTQRWWLEERREKDETE